MWMTRGTLCGLSRISHAVEENTRIETSMMFQQWSACAVSFWFYGAAWTG
jgi:hypothetical protein